MSDFEKLKDAKITELLADYFELEKIIEALPEKISHPLKERLDKLFTQVGILPEKLNESLTAIAAAVQDAEQTTVQLQASAKEAIAAATKEAVSDAQIQVGVSIGGAVQKALNDSLQATQSKLEDLQQRTDNLGGKFVDERARKYNVVLSIGLLASATVFIISMFMVFTLKNQQLDNMQEQVSSWQQGEYYWRNTNRIGLAAIPEKYQEQYNAAVEKVKKDGHLWDKPAD